MAQIFLASMLSPRRAAQVSGWVFALSEGLKVKVKNGSGRAVSKKASQVLGGVLSSVQCGLCSSGLSVGEAVSLDRRILPDRCTDRQHLLWALPNPPPRH